MTRFLPTAAILGATALSAVLYTAPAMAETIVTQPVTLSYNVLELQSAANIDDVLRDLERQANKVCMSTAPVFRTENIDGICVSEVLTQAVEGINNAALTAAFERVAG